MADGQVLTIDSTQTGGSGTIDGEDKFTWEYALGAADTARVFNVGQQAGMYASVADAVTAINALAVPPSATNRCVIKVWPGKYTSTASVTIPSWCGVQGVSKGLTQFQNDTTSIFTCSDHVWFEDFLVEGSATAALFAIEGNNASHVHIRRVDMLNNGGTARQKFFHNSGATWITLFIEDCIIDYRGLGEATGLTDYAIILENTGTAARFIDTEIQNLFSDSFALTNFGGSIHLFNVQDIRIRNSQIRGVATFTTGVRHIRPAGKTGTPLLEVHNSFLGGAAGTAGGVPIYGGANTNTILTNTDAVGALFDGTKTLRNSSIV